MSLIRLPLTVGQTLQTGFPCKVHIASVLGVACGSLIKLKPGENSLIREGVYVDSSLVLVLVPLRLDRTLFRSAQRLSHSRQAGAKVSSLPAFFALELSVYRTKGLAYGVATGRFF